MNRGPDFEELVGKEVSAEERERLRAAHELLVQAGPPPELSPGMEAVPWPEEALPATWRRRRPTQRRPLVRAVALASAALVGFLIGHSTTSPTTSIEAQRTVNLHGTKLDRDAIGSLELGKKDSNGNWPMLLRVTRLKQLPEGGYYDLYLTRHGKPIAKCGVFNVGRGVTVVRLSASYDLNHFDRNGWVVTRQLPGHHKPTDIVLKPV
ncbi:MAG TPA: hypothetical protein VF891_06555 [Gaiellaceae bacterium]